MFNDLADNGSRCDSPRTQELRTILYREWARSGTLGDGIITVSDDEYIDIVFSFSQISPPEGVSQDLYFRGKLIQSPSYPLRKEHPVFDPKKPVQLRNGGRARIIATDRDHELYPIVALVEENGQKELPRSYTKTGRAYACGPSLSIDLINVQERRYRNIYLTGQFYASRELADQHANPNLRRVGVLGSIVENGKETTFVYSEDEVQPQ